MTMQPTVSDAPDEVELDIPGEVPEGGPIGKAFADAPRREAIDTVLASFNTFVPPLATVLVVVLHLRGWYRVSAIEIGSLLVMHFVAVTGVEVGYHRLFAHASFKASRPVKIALAVMGSFAFFGPVIWWAHVHRKHHRFSDKPGDPHSMHLHGDGAWGKVLGFVHAHIGWIWTPASIRSAGWRGYVRDLYRDADLLRLQVNYVWLLALGFALPALAGGLLHGSWKGALLGFLFGGPVRMFSTNHLTYFGINTFSHSVGARPYKTSDRSTNSIPWLFAVPTMGQSYHNNHHAFPSSWRVGHRWYELDLGAWVLVVLRKLGLVWGFREPTPELMKRKRNEPS
jgi:stearoyl-CoA desaturase (delta-9 desaturase)